MASALQVLDDKPHFASVKAEKDEDLLRLDGIWYLYGKDSPDHFEGGLVRQPKTPPNDSHAPGRVQGVKASFSS